MGNQQLLGPDECLRMDCDGNATIDMVVHCEEEWISRRVSNEIERVSRVPVRVLTGNKAIEPVAGIRCKLGGLTLRRLDAGMVIETEDVPEHRRPSATIVPWPEATAQVAPANP